MQLLALVKAPRLRETLVIDRHSCGVSSMMILRTVRRTRRPVVIDHYGYGRFLLSSSPNTVTVSIRQDESNFCKLSGILVEVLCSDG